MFNHARRAVFGPSLTEQVLLVTKNHFLDRPEHWTKGKSFDKETNSYCLSGALTAAVEVVDGYNEGLLSKVLNCVSDLVPYHSILHFNDEPETTYDDIMVVLDEAIAKAPR